MIPTQEIVGESVMQHAPVSVVIPCYRCRDSIESTIKSVFAQTMIPAEVIVVDDCSEDGTLELLRSIADAYDEGWIRVISAPSNAGPSSARNLGWNQASQAYVAFLDADDSWHPEKIDHQMRAFQANPRLALLAHAMNVQSRSEPFPPVPGPISVTLIHRRNLLMANPFPTASVILRRELPFRFNEQIWRAEDYLLWAQIAMSGHLCGKISQVLASWHKPPFGAGGLSEDLGAMHKAGFEARNSLHRDGFINFWELNIAHLSSSFRYLRRIIITKRRRQAALRGRRN